MSRAFVKEIDDAPPLPLAERPVSNAPNLVTARGLRLIEARIGAIEAVLRMPGADEAWLRRDLRYWQLRRATAQLVVPEESPKAIGIGTAAIIRRGVLISNLTIVGEDEADPAEGRIAWTAPLARALDGAERGDVVEIEAGGRMEEVLVIDVRRAEG